MSYDGFIAFQARLRPRAVALITATGSLDFAAVDQLVDRFTAALAPLGLPADTVCAVAFRNPVTHWLVLLALSRLGLCTTAGGDERASFRIGEQFEAAPDAMHASDPWVASVSSAPAQPQTPVRRDPMAPGRILLSSGTTGERKRAVLSWAVIDRAARNAPVAYGPLPVGPWLLEANADTSFGFNLTLGAWFAGQPVLLRQQSELVPLLARARPAMVGLLPVQLQRLIDQLPPDFAPLPATRIVVGGGIPSLSLVRTAWQRLTHDLRILYAASECGAITVGDARALEQHPTAAGYPLPDVTLEIVDETGRAVSPGERGHVRVQSDRVVASAPLQDGWFYPGDLGRKLEDGLLLVDGRADDVMNLGGVKVLPAFVEAALDGTPGVFELAAFAVPETGRAGLWCVAVVLAAGADRTGVLAEIERRLPSLPAAYLLYVPSIPRNDMGKVDRRALLAMARNELEAGDGARMDMAAAAP